MNKQLSVQKQKRPNGRYDLLLFVDRQFNVLLPDAIEEEVDRVGRIVLEALEATSLKYAVLNKYQKIEPVDTAILFSALGGHSDRSKDYNNGTADNRSG